MCLTINKAFRVTDSPVQCYKVLYEVYEEDTGKFIGVVTPYQHTIVLPDILSGERNLVAKDKHENEYPTEWDVENNKLGWIMAGPEKELHFVHSVEDGFIHVYMNEHSVMRDAKWYCGNGRSSMLIMDGKVRKVKPIVYLCEIPVGTIYCEGNFEWTPDAGCAREIKFIEKYDYVFENKKLRKSGA